MIFGKRKRIELNVNEVTDDTIYSTSSDLGRSFTSIATARRSLYKKHIEYDPLDYISAKKQFLGLRIDTEEPFYVPYEDSTHLLYCGPTRSAKGVALAHRAIETIKLGKGLIVIDPKTDDFLPQVIYEELKKQTRPEDLIISSWPNNFSYSGFDANDTSLEFANKLIVALDLDVCGDAKADYYRRNERSILKDVCKLFFNQKDITEIKFEYNYKSFSNFINYLLSDLTSKYNYEKETAKQRINQDLKEQYALRYFNPELFNNLDFNQDDIQTLKGLLQTIKELLDANIYTSTNIEEALYSNKVIYIQADQLDYASLKMLKILQVDIIQKAKKKTANCIVIADEVSFYATKVLSDALSTIAGFGVHFILALQDLAQLSDDKIKRPILSNCQTKFFYKSSDIETLEYIEKLSGKELVTQMSKTKYDITIRQTQEDYLNITRLRALKRERVSILIAEALPSPLVVQTWHINVKHKFNWSIHKEYIEKVQITTLNKKFKVSNRIEEFESTNVVNPSELIF